MMSKKIKQTRRQVTVTASCNFLANNKTTFLFLKLFQSEQYPAFSNNIPLLLSRLKHLTMGAVRVIVRFMLFQTNVGVKFPQQDPGSDPNLFLHEILKLIYCP